MKRRLKVGLARVHRKEGNLAFRRVKREEPFFRPGRDGIECLLDCSCGPGDRRVGGPDGKVVREERDADRRRKAGNYVVDKEKEESGTKDRALRDTIAKSKLSAAGVVSRHEGSAIGKKSLDPFDKAGRESK